MEESRGQLRPLINTITDKLNSWISPLNLEIKIVPKDAP